MILLEGRETERASVTLAFALERNTEELYRQLARDTVDLEVRELFETLAQAEVHHEELLWKRYRVLCEEEVTRSNLAAEATVTAAEGGLEPQGLLRKASGATETPEDALEFTLALEVDSLDLYLRMARQASVRPAADVFFTLAEQEKTHLRWLGETLDRKVSRARVP